MTAAQLLVDRDRYAPSATVVAGIRALAFLRERGFATWGLAPEAFVRTFQASYNATNPRAPLTADGACGRKTLAAMRIV